MWGRGLWKSWEAHKNFLGEKGGVAFKKYFNLIPKLIYGSEMRDYLSFFSTEVIVLVFYVQLWFFSWTNPSKNWTNCYPKRPIPKSLRLSLPVWTAFKPLFDSWNRDSNQRLSSAVGRMHKSPSWQHLFKRFWQIMVSSSIPSKTCLESKEEDCFF